MKESVTDDQDDAVESVGESARPPALLETLVAGIPEPVVVVDASASVVAVNERLGDVVGRPATELLGDDLTSAFPDVALSDLVAACETPTGEYHTARCAGDEPRWVDLAVDRHRWDDETYYLAVAHDVTERQERQQTLEQYERIVETIDDGVYTLDDSFTIRAVNDAMASMTGHEVADLVGASASLLADDATIEQAVRMAEQLRAGERSVGTLRTTLRTADGSDLPIETRFSSYRREDGTYRLVGVVRDVSDRQRFEQTLEALHDSTRQLLQAETESDVGQHVVDAAVDVPGVDGAGLYHFDRCDNVLRPTAAAGSLQENWTAQSDVGPGGSPAWDTFVTGEETVIEGDTAVGQRDESRADGLYLPLDEHGVLRIRGGVDPDRRVRELIDLLAATAQAALARVERETSLKERDAELREQNHELRQLKQVNEIIRRIDQVLVEAETVAEIEQAVCEQLTASKWFPFAWIGRRDASTVVSRAAAGRATSYLDGVSLSTTGDGGVPAVRTARDGTMTVVPTIAEAVHTEHWRTEAISRDFQSAISVPLEHDEFTYGVLTVYADQSELFGETLQSVFAELGEIIANAIREVESRRRQVGDDAVELELSLSATDGPLVALARRLDATVTCTGAVPNGDERTRLFLRIDDSDDAVERGHAASLHAIDSVTRVSDDGLFEAVACEPTVARTLIDHGARLDSLRARRGGVHTTVQLAGDTDVRAFVEQLRQRYPDTQLSARRESTTPTQRRGDTRATLEDRLTDRQLEVLQTAYLSGFFDWPRETTGQEIAAMLDVSQPTVNRHLRVSQRKVLELVFDKL